MSAGHLKFKDFFSKQADVYAKARPSYPDELFNYLASLCEGHDLAWDCATGNGQAAASLAKYFKKVIATDASTEQLKRAKPYTNVEYRIALAGESGLEDNSVDLITVANAIHWFELDKFYKEAGRVLKHGGVICAWTYAKSGVNEKVDVVMDRLAHEILEDYWPAGSRIAQNGYKDIHLPFESITAPEIKYNTEVDLGTLMGFARSWSSAQKYIDLTGKDPLDLVKSELISVWGNENEIKVMSWTLALKVGRKK